MKPNSSNLILSPSILSADFGKLTEQVQALESDGADWVHIDVMDGHFVPNLTIGPCVVEACRRATNLPLDVHLMVQQPDALLDAFAKAGADTITVHVEACLHIHRTLQTIHSLGCHAGVALNPGTPTEMLSMVLDQADMVLVLGTNPGFSGQKWIPQMLDKIIRLREMIEHANLEKLIEVDGGMTPATLPQVYAAGARVFVAGNAVFKHPLGIAAGIADLRASIL